MIGSHRFAVGRRVLARRRSLRFAATCPDRAQARVRQLGLALLAALGLALYTSAAAAAQPASYRDRGLRWVGRPQRCLATPDWRAERVFRYPAAVADVADYCLYTWNRKGAPTRGHVAELFLWAAARLVEDVPVVEPMQASWWTSEEVAFYAGLRRSLLAHVGTAELLPAMPAAPVARVVVLDTAPDAGPFATRDGVSRHGDTLARLIEDLVCHPGSYGGTGTPRKCAAEVTTELAMPWLSSGVRGPDGGRTGTLVDLARAIERAIERWDNDRAASARAPRQLILNLSLGWEHTPVDAECHADPRAPVEASAQLVQDILRYAASRGVLVLAAAGNDAGGPAPRQGLTCPAAYQGLLAAVAPPRPLVLAVGGVDYADRPLESARPLARPPLLATGLGGMAWVQSAQAPPALTGSSVATAIASAVAALVWAQQPAWGAAQVSQAVHQGGVPVPGPAADACPPTFSCAPRRLSACGALIVAGAAAPCVPAVALATSSPPLPAELAALIAALPGPPSPPLQILVDPDPSLIPRFAAPSAQVEPWTFPMPIQATCPTCYAGMTTGGEVAHVALRNLGKTLWEPMLVVHFDPDAPAPGERGAVRLGEVFLEGATIEVALPESWTLQSAYLTAFTDAAHTRSINEQLFVHRPYPSDTRGGVRRLSNSRVDIP